MTEENRISEIIGTFRAGNLQELDSQKLLSRIDTKYIVSVESLEKILLHFRDNYSVLEVNSKREFDYFSRYYDTPDYYFYLCHHNGRCNRYKIRYRLYNDSETAFMEIKHKNKGNTDKKRIPSPVETPAITPEDEKFISKIVGERGELLVPKLDITYRRITLFSTESHDKITIDRNVGFRSTEFGKSASIDKAVLIEVKTKSIASAYPIMVMREMGFHQSSVSKYCIGIALTCDDVKHNKFKRNILAINKISETGK